MEMEENGMHELHVEAATENLEQVLDFVQSRLEELDCPMKIQTQIAIAVEEIYVNIAHYAYYPETGQATVSIEFAEDSHMLVIRFIDSGVPFNPLEREDPDIKLPAEERGIGGLGIYMVKKSMDDVSYEYTNGQNVLTIMKMIV